jgi:hypothetical protein
MSSRNPGLALPSNLDELVAESRQRRAGVVAKYIGAASRMSLLMDEFLLLHSELDDDDRLHEALNALIFTWEHFEEDLIAAAAPARN